MQSSSGLPVPILTIYATVRPNRDICGVKVVCKDGLEINFPNEVFERREGSREKQSKKNRVSCLLGRVEDRALLCKCGDFINQDISILQCPECLNRSLPSIVKTSLNGEDL